MKLIFALYLGCMVGIYADLKVKEHHRMNPPPMTQEEIDSRDLIIDNILAGVFPS